MLKLQAEFTDMLVFCQKLLNLRQGALELILGLVPLKFIFHMGFTV